MRWDIRGIDAGGRRRVLFFWKRGEQRLMRMEGVERVVLLQGPVGPFFRELQACLGRSGYDVWRINFHAGDRVFSRRGKRIGFYGDLDDWARWFTDFAEAVKVDTLILYGSERPVHQVARLVAEPLGIRVIALEEGYIRPGYITVERGGNNAASPLAGKLPPSDFEPDSDRPRRGENFYGFTRMSLYGACYYALRTLFSFGKQRDLFHRPIQAFSELFYWARNGWRRMVGQTRNFATIENLLEHHDGSFYVVPLQVAKDSQLKEAALGWNNLSLISGTLKSFAACAPAGHRLVFKVHPLERGHHNLGALIRNTADAYGISDRVDTIDTGSLGLLARHSAGMITINSTSGLSAIYHGIPLLVIGKALYAHPALATCAKGCPDFDSFWGSRHVAPREERMKYLSWIRQEALMEGDFYGTKGIEVACQSVLKKLRELSGTRKQKNGLRAAC